MIPKKRNRKSRNLIGSRFGQLLVVDKDPFDKRRVICHCECGNEVTILKGSLTRKTGQPIQTCGHPRLKYIYTFVGKP